MKKINSILHALFDQSLASANIRLARYGIDDVGVTGSNHKPNAKDSCRKRRNDEADEGGESRQADEEALK